MSSRSRPCRWLCAALLVLSLACDREDTAVEPAQSSVVAARPEGPAVAWHELEQRRDAKAVLEALTEPHASGDRAAAARALARIGGSQSRERLKQLLADDDLDVVRWAALGVGFSCDPVAPQVKALLGRTASLYALSPVSPERTQTLRALAQALGACGSDAAEQALRAWLTQGGELGEHGAWGLGRLATRHGHLAESTQVALLTVAGQGSAAALYPFTRLTRLSDAVQNRLLEVAGQALTSEPGALRTFAVRALPQAGAGAAAVLGQVLRNAAFSSEERAMAAQALGRLGGPGQGALASAVSALPRLELTLLDGLSEEPPSKSAPTAATAAALSRATAALEAATVWSAALAELEAPGAARARLREIARLEVPSSENPLGRRRAVALRCRAADLLAGPNPGDPVLRACDPDDTPRGALALLRALDRASIEGQRLATWRELVQDPRPLVRQAALRLLAGHTELEDSAQVLRQALESDQLGTATTALQLLAAYPARGATGTDVDRALALAVEATLRRKEWSQSIELSSAALDAAGALGVLSMKGLVESYCKSPHAELRDHAARALGLLGDPKRRCAEVVPWPRPTAAPAGTVHLEIVTALGILRLHLDGAAAPAAVRRITDLAQAGYYDGLAIHRVVEGFVVQIGDRPGDGFGDPKQSPLPCERGPGAFEPLDVGMAIAGRDTATTQWFVTLARYPQLDSAYTRIGRAEGPFRLLAEGDRILSMRVAEIAKR